MRNFNLPDGVTVDDVEPKQEFSCPCCGRATDEEDNYCLRCQAKEDKED